LILLQESNPKQKPQIFWFQEP